jgi:hypothetical protein
MITVLTPTTGKTSLNKLIESIDTQTTTSNIFHILLWDNKREPNSPDPASFNSTSRFSIVCPDGSGRNGAAPGSMLRSIGLMAARTQWVTLADDDVWWEPNHIELLEKELVGKHWSSTLRKIWSPSMEKLGIDRFESVGNDISRRVPYEMCDGNTMIFQRELGVQAAMLYRETVDYNDDRLMYAFLKANAGTRGSTGIATINHICPEKLIEFFRTNCSRQ